jgi:hypothetical protein
MTPTRLQRPFNHLVAATLLGLAITGAARAQYWEGGQLLLEPAQPEFAGWYGAAVAVGDFNGDGYDDIAVGAPFMDLSAHSSGRVEIWFGQPGRFFFRSNPLSFAKPDSFAGTSLAAGDFDHDGKDELAFSAPSYPSVDAHGTAHPGAGRVGIVKCNFGTCWIAQTLDELNTWDLVPRDDDRFGWTLATGNFNDDTLDDLAVGVPGDDRAAGTDTGSAVVFYGDFDAPLLGTRQNTAFNLVIAAGENGIDGTPGPFDEMGDALVACDVDHDGIDDLAIGAPIRTVGGATAAGQVHILRGFPSGLVDAGQQLLSDDDFPNGQSQQGDDFGAALGCLRHRYLVIGVPGQQVKPTGADTPVDGAGKALVVPPSVGGADPANAETLNENNDAGGSVPEKDDHFGQALSPPVRLSGSPAGSPAHDALIVGAPDENINGVPDCGLTDTYLVRDNPIPGNVVRAVQTLSDLAGFLSAPARPEDGWGDATAIGDFDNDGQPDLVVGLIRYAAGGQEESGAVQVLFGALFADGFESHSLARWSAHSP